MLDSVGELSQSELATGMQSLSHCNVVCLRQILKQADENGVELTIDTSKLEGIHRHL